MIKQKLLMLLMISFSAMSACQQSPYSTQMPVATLDATSTTAPDLSGLNEPCAFVEAHQDLPDITNQVDGALKLLQPEASARAVAYGENCVSASGNSSFGAMETDFYVTVNATDLNDDDELGTWVLDVMSALEPFKPGVVPGPENGFVEITFQTDNHQRILHISINAFRRLPSGLHGAEIVQALFPRP
jgi:hypothetical protein